MVTIDNALHMSELMFVLDMRMETNWFCNSEHHLQIGSVTQDIIYSYTCWQMQGILIP